MIDISGHLRSHRQECGYDDPEHSLTINCCGYQKFITKDFSRHREKGRLDYQLIYITKGCGHFLIDGRRQDVQEGQMVLYRPGVIQSYHYACSDGPEVYWVHFTGSGAGDLLQSCGLGDVHVFSTGLSNSLITDFKQMMQELQVKKPLFSPSVNAIFSSLLVNAGRRFLHMKDHAAQGRDEPVRQIIELMHSSYHLRWSVQDFARRCNLSSFRFIHNFKSFTGMSPIEYLTKVRIDKARELLHDSSLNISEIADVLGYENALYFSRVFKNSAGMSPTEFRKRSSEQLPGGE